MGGSRHVVSKFRPLGPIFLCFRVSIFESQQIRAVCRPLANAQNTPQNPVQDRFLNYRRIGAMRRMNDFSKIDLCLRSANILKFVHLKFLGPETGKMACEGQEFGTSGGARQRLKFAAARPLGHAHMGRHTVDHHSAVGES